MENHGENVGWLEKLERNGFLIQPCVVDEALAGSLIRELNQPGNVGSSVRQRQQETYAIRNLLESVPAMRELAGSLSIRSLVEPVLGKDAIPVRGLLFDKTPEANWKVAWHQDLSIAVQRRVDAPGFGPWSVKAGIQHVQPPASVLESMLTVRLHLDDCGEENGPLQVLPGSHRVGKLSTQGISEWRGRVSPVTCAVERGGALLMRPLLLHASSAACNPGHRRVVHLEFASGALPGGLKWLDEQTTSRS